MAQSIQLLLPRMTNIDHNIFVLISKSCDAHHRKKISWCKTRQLKNALCALSGRHRYHLQCIFHTKHLFSGAGIALQTPIKRATDPGAGRRSGLVLADLEVIIQTLDDLETTLGSHKNSWTGRRWQCKLRPRLFIGFFSWAKTALKLD